MKIVRKINTLDDALSVFEQSAIEHGEATKEGNFKVGNKAYDRMIKAVSFIRANGSNTDLLPFLEHTDINTRISAAAFIIHDHQQQAVSVLEEVRNRNDIFAHTANLVLSQWKAGRLSL